MKTKGYSSNSKNKKNKLLIFALCCVIAAFMSFAACGPDEEPKPVYYDEAGVYYCVVDGEEYQVALNEGVATLMFEDGVKTVAYKYEGEKFVMTTLDGAAMNATLSGTNLTLEYDGTTYNLLKKVDYTVTFESNGGTAVPAVKVMNGKTVSQPAAPEKDGQKFVAWYADSAFTTPFAFDSDVVLGDITLYARYVDKSVSANEFTVKFDTNGGKEIAATETVNGVVFDLPEAEKEDATFIGWWVSDSNNGEKLSYRYDGQALKANTTLYAVYKTDAPAVSVNENGVTWTATGAGVSYTVKITDPNGGESSSSPTTGTSYEYSFANLAAGEYKVEVTVGGKTGVAYYSNKTLDRVSQFTVVEPAVLLYNAVENATQYFITVDCGNDDHNHTELNNGAFTSFNFVNCAMQEGGIKFTVTASARGYASSVSETFVYERNLGAIEMLEYDEDNAVFTWSKVDKALYYEVEVVNGDKTDVYSVTNTSFALENYKGEITVSVTPKAEGYNSPEAATYTCSINRLTAPTGIKQYSGNAGEKITWDEVEGAVSYKVMIGDTVIETTETIISVPEDVLIAGSVYELSVMAVAENAAENSWWSAPITVTYQKINSISYADGVVSWNMVAGARAYGVSINDGEVTYEINDGATSAEVEFVRAGETEITVSFYDFYYSELGSVSMTVYVHELAFDAQGGEAVESMFVASGDRITLPETTREGRIFSGWYNVPGGPKNNGMEYAYNFFNGNASMTLYAYWTPKPEDVTLVIEATEEGEFSENVFELTHTVYYDNKFTLPTPTVKDLTKAFDGYYDANGIRLTDANGVALNNWNGVAGGKVYALFKSIFTYKLVNDATYGEGWRISAAPAINVVKEVNIPVSYTDPETGKTLPVIEIAPNAFYFYDNIAKIRIPDSVKIINLGAGGPSAIGSSFQFCNGLTAIEVYCPDEANHATHDIVYADDGNGALLRKNAGEGDNTTYDLVFVPYGKTGDYTVPNNVTAIANNVFAQSRLARVTVSASVVNVGTSAFAGSLIHEIKFENPTNAGTVLSFGKNAFVGSGNLNKIVLPARQITFSTEGFDVAAFKGCSMLSAINVDGVGGNYTSNGGIVCDETGTEIVFCPVGFTGDANNSYTVPNVIEVIGAYAFSGCRSIKEVKINEFVTSIKEGAFSNCIALSNVEFGGTEYSESKALTIEKHAFLGCISLNNLVLPANLKLVQSNAFAGTRSLKNVEFDCTANATFEAGVFTDGKTAYVVNVTFGKNVAVLENLNAIFTDCQIQAFKLAEGNDQYASDAFGVLYSGNGEVLLYAPYVDINNPDVTGSEYKIPATVKTIAANAFAGRMGLYAIEIPATVTTLNAKAFANSGITNLTFATRTDGLTIGDEAFLNCDELKTLTLIENVVALGDGAFKGCDALASIAIPATLTDMDPAMSFADCVGVQTITIAGENTAFASVNNVVYGKTDGVVTTLYFAANMAGEIVVPDTVRTVAQNAFANTTGVTKVTFAHDGSFDVEIGEGAFLNATGLTEVSLPEGLKEVSYEMFSGCLNVVKISIPGTVEVIKNLAFANCASLTTLEFRPGTAPLVVESAHTETANSKFPGGIQYMLQQKNRPFLNCTSLEVVEFPERTVELGSYLFYQETSLKRVVIPSTVEIIGSEYPTNAAGTANTFSQGYVFNGCTSLEELIFAATDPELNKDGKLVSKLTKLGGNMFRDCAFKSVVLPDSITKFGSQMFMTCTKMEYAKLPTGITGLSESNTFYGCSSLKEVVIPDHYNTFAMGTFRDCVSLESITLPSGLKTFGNNVFYGCTSLKSIELPEGMNANPSGTNVFQASGLETVYIPAQITSIPNNYFNNTKNLETVIFAEGSKLTSIGTGAFMDSGIKSIVLPDKVTTLSSNCFKNCERLESVTLPASLTNITQAFVGCDNLKSVTVANNNTSFAFGGNILYKVSNGELVTVTKTGTVDGVLVIPDNVKSIGSYALSGFDWITKVVIPASVTSIGTYAFYESVNIEEIEFLKDESGKYGIKTIGNYAFSNSTTRNNAGEVSKLKSFYVPNSVTSVGQNAFAYATSLEEVVWDTTAALPNYAFLNCTALKDVTLNENLTTINDNVFNGCSALEEIELPAGLKALGNNATGSSVFSGCTSLKEVVIPAGIGNRLNGQVFRNCTSLETVVLPSTITTIGNYAFAGCTNLKNIDLSHIDNFGTTAYAYCLQDCASLEAITIKSTAQLHGSSFMGCTNLKTVNLLDTGASAMLLEDSVFKNCTSLTSISLPNVVALHTEAFSGCTSLEYAYLPKVASFHMASTYAGYDDGQFLNCTALKSVVLGNVAVIPEGMFMNCTSLTSFSLGSSVTEIGVSAFENSGITAINLPATIATIEERAFYNTAIATVEIPATVSLIGEGAFAACTKLTSIIVDSRNAYYQSSLDIAADNKALADVLYDKADNLLTYPAGKFVVGNVLDLTTSGLTFGPYAFAGCQHITAVKLPEIMTEIPAYAFYNSGIRAMEIKSHIDYVGGYAFAGCTELTNLFIADTVLSLGGVKPGTNAVANGHYGHAFDGCISLTAVELPKSLVEISSYAFANTGLTEVVIPESVTAIGKSAFENTKLTSFVVPENVVEIGESAFYNVETLTELTLHGKIEEIGGAAFAKTGLTKIVIPATTPETWANLTTGGIQLPGMGQLPGGSGSTEIAPKTGNVFADCKNLTEAVFLGNVCWSVSSIFKGCEALTSVTLPEGMETIVGDMFNGCTSLEGVKIPSSVKKIDRLGFQGVDFESIVIPETVTEIAKEAFIDWTADQTIYVCISEAEANLFYEENWSGDATVVYDYEA